MTKRLLPSIVLAASHLCRDSVGYLLQVSVVCPQSSKRAERTERQETGLVSELPEAGRSMKEGHRDWASLPLAVVNSFVRVLKDTRTWRLEGRSLRLLNRHWSAAINIHVEEIRPYTTRSIVDEDIASLPKFERTTSVDISPFLTRPRKNAMPINSEQKRLYLENWYATRLERIVDVLCHLPQLTQIEVGLKVVTILHNHCSRIGEQFSRLEGITSVYFYENENLRLYGKTHLNTNWTGLRLNAPHSDYSDTLMALVCNLRRLETLEVEGSVLVNCTQFGFLDQVKHVTIKGVNTIILAQLSNPSATVSSVVVFSPTEFEKEILVQQTRLDGLSLASVGHYDLDQLPRTSAAECLKVLDMEGFFEFEDFAFPIKTYIETFRRLECLNIRSFFFMGASLRGNLPNLKALRIVNCILKDSDVLFVTQFHELRLLNWHGVRNSDEEALHLPWKELNLPKLRSLSVYPILDDSELLSISRQTNLEVLHIGSGDHAICAGAVTSEGICAIENLHNLRMLQCSFVQRRILLSLLSTTLVTRLEQLWLLCISKYQEDDQILERIRCKSPHMVLRVGRPRAIDFHLFDLAYFI